MLFVELVLIRWTAENDVYLRFFTNFVLLASFLGIGIGFLRSGRQRNLSRYAPGAIAVLAIFVVTFPVQQGRSGDLPVLLGLFGMPSVPAWIALPITFLLVTAVMAVVGETVARTFRTFDALTAYRYDVLGSLLGIASFTVLSFLGTRPVIWSLVIAALLFMTLERPIGWRRYTSLAGIVLVFGANSLSSLDAWSPYYKVTTVPTSDGRVALRVNGLPHQSMYPIDLLRQRQPFYDYPYTHLEANPLNDVLIVGAGSGNDVAIALSHGAKHIDAVEIDPILQARGMAMHPEDPYGDPRVTPHVNDGRAFLESTDQRYDLIAFALPDSMTLVSGQGALRLESYLFTEEAFQSVRDHLTPEGSFTLYNYYRPDVFRRYAATLALVFGHEPCFDPGTNHGGGARIQAVLTISRDPSALQCTTLWQDTTNAPAPVTDDRPFPYIAGRTLPLFYAGSLALILAASLLIVGRTAGGTRQMQPYTDLFFMGAAFLLLETKNVVQFALLFGTTWFVNALVFAGILISVYLAIEVTRRVRIAPRFLYVGLFTSLVLAWLIPGDRILSLSTGPRLLAGIALAFAPVFFANLIFSQRFADTASSTVAFGANLLGAILGGVVEYAAVSIGYRDLLIVVAFFYLLALLFERRGSHVRVLPEDSEAGRRSVLAPEPTPAP